MDNKYHDGVVVGNIPGALQAYLQHNNCQASLAIDMLFSNDTFDENVGLKKGGAVNVYFTVSCSSQWIVHNECV